MWPVFAWFGLAGLALIHERRHPRGAAVGLVVLVAVFVFLALVRPLFIF